MKWSNYALWAMAGYSLNDKLFGPSHGKVGNLDEAKDILNKLSNSKELFEVLSQDLVTNTDPKIKARLQTIIDTTKKTLDSSSPVKRDAEAKKLQTALHSVTAQE